MRTSALIHALAISAFIFPTTAIPQEFTSKRIIEALKSTGKTRSFKGEMTLDAADRAFVNGIRVKTRTITVVEREKLDSIVEDNELPALDLAIYFDFDSAEITSRAEPDLMELGLALTSAELGESSFMVAGHTDVRGSNDYNLSLSERRAASVRTYLVEKFDIDDERLIPVGYGEERLKNIDRPEADENRRVEIVNFGN